jgi:hypothetical protein
VSENSPFHHPQPWRRRREPGCFIIEDAIDLPIGRIFFANDRHEGATTGQMSRSQAREAVGEREAYTENEAKLAALFERAKSSVTYAVSRNRTVKRVNMDELPPFVVTGKLPSNLKHPYHHIFKDYDAWGAENDLILDFRYQHDGGGLGGWYEIAFVPRGDR